MPASSRLGRSETSRASLRRLGPWFAVFGLLVVSVLSWRAGLRETASSIRQVGFGTVAIVVAPVGGMFFHCLGWLALLPKRLRPRLDFALLAYVAAQAGDEVGLGIAGEPLKILALPKPARPQSAAAVALDNLAQLLALGCFVLFAVPALRIFTKTAVLGTPVVLAGWGACVIVVGLVCLAALTVRPRDSDLEQPHTRFERFRMLVNQAHVAWRSNPRRMLSSVFFHLLGKSWIIVEMALALSLLGADPRLAFWLAPCSVLASLAGAPIPGQLGTVEAGLAAAGAVAGMEATTVMALALLRRLRAILWVGAGILLAKKVLDHGTGTEAYESAR